MKKIRVWFALAFTAILLIALGALLSPVLFYTSFILVRRSRKAKRAAKKARK